jgi:hypothetical protein
VCFVIRAEKARAKGCMRLCCGPCLADGCWLLAAGLLDGCISVALLGSLPARLGRIGYNGLLCTLVVSGPCCAMMYMCSRRRVGDELVMAFGGHCTVYLGRHVEAVAGDEASRREQGSSDQAAF